MTASEYATWIKGVNSDKRKRRRGVMLTDNAPTRMVTEADVEEEHGFKVINLSHLKLVFLPANTTSVVQPLDQGIIACTKAHYRKLVQWVIAEAEKIECSGKSLKDLCPTFYQMMHWLNTAWKECVSPLSTRNCWHKAGILPEGWIAAPTGTNAQRGRAAQEAPRQPDAQLSVQQAAQQAGPPAVQPSVQREEEQPGTSTEVGSSCEDKHVNDQVFAQLHTALQRLHVCVRRNQSLLPHGDAVLTAEEYHELEGECEVFEELSDAATVRMIQSNYDVDLVDSDEDEADDFVDVSTTKSQALQLAAGLLEFALAQPHLFDVADVSALQNMHGALAKAIESGKEQTSLKALFGARM
jgi:hypothetical protein